MKKLTLFLTVALALVVGAQTILNTGTFNAGRFGFAASGPNFALATVPGLMVGTYNTAITSNEVYAGTIRAANIPVVTLWETAGEIASGGSFDNIFLENSNCPAVFPWSNPTVGGAAMQWPGTNVMEWQSGTHQSGYLDSLFVASQAGPSTVTELTAYFIFSWSGANNYFNYDYTQAEGTNAHFASLHFYDQSPFEAYIENAASGNSSVFDVTPGDIICGYEDWPTAGTITLAFWDCTSHTSLGSVTITDNAGTGSLLPSKWAQLLFMGCNNTEGQSQVGTHLGFAFEGYTTNASPIAPTFF